MTATIDRPQQPKSILATRRHNHGAKSPRPGTGGITAGHKKAATPVVVGADSSATKPRLLKNLRNYYARRRPSMHPTPSSALSPTRIVSPGKQQRISKVRFEQRVCVNDIPSHREYSQEEKKSIWMSRAELKKLMIKNHAEFAYEGRDWRNAPEEDEFTMDENGQRTVHPMHSKKKMKVVMKKKKVVAAKRTIIKKAPTPPKRKVLQRRKLPMSADRADAVVATVSDDSSSSDEEEEEPCN